MQFELSIAPPNPANNDFLIVGQNRIPIIFIQSRRARRYILRLKTDGIPRVTVPRGGTVPEARQFAERNRPWLERQFQKLAQRPTQPAAWTLGTEILFRGERVRIQPADDGGVGRVCFGTERLSMASPEANLRGAVEKHLWRLATGEFPPLVLKFAAMHGLPVRRVTVRNQRSRWGSCSRRGTISLNWRLIQTPAFVRDYVILHELAHLREMNHSPRFWREVERLCPDYRRAEKWLKENKSLVRT